MNLEADVVSYVFAPKSAFNISETKGRNYRYLTVVQ